MIRQIFAQEIYVYVLYTNLTSKMSNSEILMRKW